MIQDVECPYCGKWQEINHDDGYGYEEGVLHQQDCGDCDKTFCFETSVSFSYDSRKADCLNGSDHDWQVTKIYPEYFNKMRCAVCDEERQPTDEERKIYNIPTSYDI